MNSLHKNKRQMDSVIWKWWKGYGNQFGGKDSDSGLISGSSTMTMPLRMIPKNDFEDCFRQWHHRLTKCMASQGEYFEGDSSR
jgi:hypothetical protein